MHQRLKQRSFESLVAYFEKSILSGQIESGKRLPSEREIEDTFRIARGTVREAFRALEQKGLIEIKQGAGAFVTGHIDPDQVGGTLATLIRHQKVSFECLYELRDAIEVNAAAYATERAKPEDILSLKESLQELESLFHQGDGHYSEFFRHEMMMHRKLVMISNNPLFDWISATLTLNLGSTRHLIADDKKAAEDSLNDWREIINALENRKMMLTRSILSSHLMNFKRIMDNRTKQNGETL